MAVQWVAKQRLLNIVGERVAQMGMLLQRHGFRCVVGPGFWHCRFALLYSSRTPRPASGLAAGNVKLLSQTVGTDFTSRAKRMLVK